LFRRLSEISSLCICSQKNYEARENDKKRSNVRAQERAHKKSALERASKRESM